MSASAPQIPPDVQAAHRHLSPAAEHFLEHLLDHPDRAAQLVGIEQGLPGWMTPYDITWPTLVDARRVAEMERATVGVCKLIKSIPAVVFGGDLGAMGAFYGYDPLMLAAMFSVRDYANSTVARCDFIDTPGGLMCCEVNMAANLGGWHQRFWRERYLRHPVLMDFSAREGISPDVRDVLATFCQHMIDDALDSGVIEEGGELNVAVTLNRPPTEGARRHAAEVYAELLRRDGRGVTGDLWLCGAPAEELTFQGLDVYMGERRVHVIYEYAFAPPSMQVLRSQLVGRIRVYNGAATRMWVDKRNLALLSEHEELEAWTEEDRQLIRDHIPWTRLVSPRTTTWRGAEVQFPGFLVDHRDSLVLKRGMGIGGAAVHVGRYLTPEDWEARVGEAMEKGGWIVQERVESRPYVYPPRPGDVPVPNTVIWGLFCTGRRYAGGCLRMLPQDAGEGIVNGARGAYEGAILEI
ncbi:hypothetical protein [Longimicrobium sp.]|uniref:hypothetical protein n=1 Tax=Longimicrobium sp. TaxID=2029185 RepID=UPI003B3A1109